MKKTASFINIFNMEFCLFYSKYHKSRYSLCRNDEAASNKSNDFVPPERVSGNIMILELPYRSFPILKEGVSKLWDKFL